MNTEKEKESYEDRILLKLRRKYSKDETVEALNKKISSLEIEKGELLSEVDHLKHVIKELKSLSIKKESEIVRNSAIYIQQQKILKERGELIRKLLSNTKS